MRGMRELSSVNLARGESKLHEIIRGWGMALPLDIYYFNRGLLFAPMLKMSTWFEYLVSYRSQILLGGFSKEDPAAGGLLQSFWEAYRFEHPQHHVYVQGLDLRKCVPVSIYADEGRGLRKAPVQVVGFETMFGLETANRHRKLLSEGSPGGCASFWEAADHTGRGSSLASRILLWVLPHSASCMVLFWLLCLQFWN